MTSRQLSPVWYGACGAAAGYYGLGSRQSTGRVFWVLMSLIGLIMVISVIRVLVQGQLWFIQNPRKRYLLRKCNVYILAVSAGFSLGIAGPGVQPIRFGLPETQVIGIYGTLWDDPRSLHDGRGMGKLALHRVSGIGGIRASAQGTIRVFFPQEAMPDLKEFGRGSELYIEGSLSLPDGSSIQDALFRSKAVYIVQAAPLVEQFRTGVRMKVIEQFTGPVWGGLALALLVGISDSLDTQLATSYRYAGCSHVLSLSGMHLAILTGVIAFFLKKPLGLKPAAVLGSVFIVVYVYLVGNVPSLTRSALMYLLGTFAILKRLPKQPASLLGMTFLIQMLIQPESGYSISFMLSYLALGGLLCIGEPIHTLIQGMVPEILAQPLSASMGAFIGTSAVVAWFFETIRPVGIVSGLIIVPLTTFFMIGAMAFLVLNMLLPWLVRPLGIILTIVYDVLEGVTSLSGLAPGISMNPFVILAASVGIWGLVVFCNQRQNLWRKQLGPFD